MLQPYLAASAYIDSEHPLVQAQAAALAAGCLNEMEVAKNCFEFVRDHIKHSWDFQQNPVTCKASDVLLHGTGYCYAKSHLLAALLRANNIAAGLCYQRLKSGNADRPYCLHGLNAVHLKGHGWYRIDARGNKPGVDAAFTPPIEKLAFAIVETPECNFPEIWAEPLPLIVKALTECQTVMQVFENLPDIEVLLTQ